MLADGCAAAFELEFAANGFCSIGGSDVNCSYGLIGSSAGWAGYSGYSDAVVGFGDFTDVLG